MKSNMAHPEEDADSLRVVQERMEHFLSLQPRRPRADESVLLKTYFNFLETLPRMGKGIEHTTFHLLHHIAPALSSCSLSPNYYGFVTGGVTPAARVADHIVGTFDQNVQVHLPQETIATAVEDRALTMLLNLFDLDPENWTGRTLTTGATSSNVLGLACGREYVIGKAITKYREQQQQIHSNGEIVSVGEKGLLAACRAGDIENIHVLTTAPHSSLGKAASIVGLGRSSVVDVSKDEDGLTFDLSRLKAQLELKNTVSIVAISCAEVNTGRFATHGIEEYQAIRSLCDEYGAWIHVDGAFGIFARLLDESPEFSRLRGGAEGLELADSITGDAHKLLNVPYDCGFFFCRHKYFAKQAFQNANAAYLKVATTGNEGCASIESPLNIGIENSRRFRGLPVYATLVAYGHAGYKDMLQRQIRFARAVAAFIFDHPSYELLPENLDDKQMISQEVFIVVLFKAKDYNLNVDLVRMINEDNRIYVSGTKWKGQPASRIAVANWQVDEARDLALVKKVFESVLTNCPEDAFEYGRNVQASD